MKLAPAIALSLAVTVTPSLAADAPAPDRLIADYSSAYRALGMAHLQLPYRSNIRTLVAETDRVQQRAMFSRFARELAAVGTIADPCQRLDLQRIGFEVETNLRKLDLLDKYAQLDAPVPLGDGGLHSAAMGRDWYLYFLRRWLTSDVTPLQLAAFGRSELAAAQHRYAQLQATMGYAGRDQAFRAWLAGDSFRYPAGETPQADYEAKQATVFRNMGSLFAPHQIRPALVKESSQGAAFPADGYYDGTSLTYYFNNSRGYFGRRNLDMLILHESTPGHHFQSHYAEQRHACPAVVPYVFYSAFAEGWSAYVEEFGKQLGLYRTPSDELGAVEWDLVRSIRVVLDVGINFDGWSDQRAHDYWQQELPMLPELADREINRVREWPAQAITYKYGASVIRQLRSEQQARLGPAFDIRTFHDDVLKNGSLPLALLPAAVQKGAAPRP
jgi:uncharacterized protein (DUF885 family)